MSEHSLLKAKIKVDEIEDSLTTAPLCGKRWLLNHALAYTQKDIDNLTIEVKSGKHNVTLKSNLKEKDIRAGLAVVINFPRPNGRGIK